MSGRLRWEKIAKAHKFRSGAGNMMQTPVYVSEETKATRAQKVPGMKPCTVPYCWKFIPDTMRFCAFHTYGRR